ncbi:MAG: NADH-quinone oxidoreductase subunit C [Bacteroidia bacterium]
MGTFNNQHIINELTESFGSDIYSASEPYGMLTIEINPQKIAQVAEFLFNHKSLQFTFLTDICGIHTPDVKDKELGVIYHFHSLINNIRIRVKCFLPDGNAHLPTISHIFSAANWQERETYDFYGIVFDGHPNLKRILNVDEMEYFPLRKEYPLEDQTRTDKDDKYFGR